jgi:hypothetical protein
MKSIQDYEAWQIYDDYYVGGGFYFVNLTKNNDLPQ